MERLECHPIPLRCERALLLLIAIFTCVAVHAQPSFYEVEPKDTPEDFTEITGAVTHMGTVGGTGRDGYVGTVSDVETIDFGDGIAILSFGPILGLALVEGQTQSMRPSTMNLEVGTQSMVYPLWTAVNRVEGAT